MQSDDLASVHWIGHCSSAESFGKAWDTWRTELSDSKSVAAKLNERFEKCVTNGSRRGYDLHGTSRAGVTGLESRARGS